MRSCHTVSAGFDDPDLVSCAGLIPVMALAERAGLHDLTAAHVRVPGAGGSNPVVKVAALVAGMVAGADTIDAMDLLRHGGMGRVFTAVGHRRRWARSCGRSRSPHVRQLDAVASRVLVNLAGRAPLLVGADQVAYLDIDDTIKATFGHKKQGAGYGYSGVKGLNALLATCSTPVSAPVIAATRLRRGATNSAKGAARLVADALVTAAKAGATGQVTVRCDSAYDNHDVIAAARTGGDRLSLTARMDPAVTRAITQIPNDAWVGIKYPHAIYDQDEHRWISDAEVAEIAFTAFTSRRRDERIGARLIVRRVKRLNPATVPAGQGALFSTWRHHAVFTDSAESMLAAEATHRDHANAREGHRRAEERPARAPPVRANQRERRMAGPGGDLVQPDPRRRDPGLQVPRQGDHCHDPDPAHRRARPHRPLSPPAPPPPARPMALGDRLAGDVHHRQRATDPRDLTTSPQRRNQGPEVEDPDRPAPHPRPNQKQRTSGPISAHQERTGGSRLSPRVRLTCPGSASLRRGRGAAPRPCDGDRSRGCRVGSARPRPVSRVRLRRNRRSRSAQLRLLGPERRHPR